MVDAVESEVVTGATAAAVVGGVVLVVVGEVVVVCETAGASSAGCGTIVGEGAAGVGAGAARDVADEQFARLARSGGGTCCAPEEAVGSDAGRLEAGVFFTDGFVLVVDDNAALLVGVDDGAEILEGMKVEALVRGNLTDSAAPIAGVSGSHCLGWSTDCRPCRPPVAGCAGVAAALIGGFWCGSDTGVMVLPSGASSCPGPCGFPRPGSSAGAGPCPVTGPAAPWSDALSGGWWWLWCCRVGSADTRDFAELLLSRSAERKVGSLEELWFCRWVCGQVEDAEVVDDSDEDDVSVDTAVVDELVREPRSMDDRRAC